MSRFLTSILLLALPLAACAPPVDDAADIEAIRQTAGQYAAAVNAGDVDGATAPFLGDAVYALPNMARVTGTEAIRAAHQGWFGQVTNQFSVEVVDVRVNGDRAVAQGTWKNSTTPKAGGDPLSDSGSWGALYERQADGSWKWVWVVPNSDQLLPGTTADGADEQALMQIEQEWAKAAVTKDAAALEPLLAAEYSANIAGQVMSKKQTIAETTRRDVMVESATATDVRPLVFGDRALVTGIYTVKSTTRGKDSSARNWFADVFVKRDGRWQALSTTATNLPMP